LKTSIDTTSISRQMSHANALPTRVLTWSAKRMKRWTSSVTAVPVMPVKKNTIRDRRMVSSRKHVARQAFFSPACRGLPK
jgi:hypothetical protein